MMNGMEHTLERPQAEQKEKRPRRLDDADTFQAIAQIEGPSWAQLQDDLANDRVSRSYYETSFQRALDLFAQSRPSEIHGAGGTHHYLVDRSGVIRFSRRQAERYDPAETEDILARVRSFGFEICP